MKPGNFTVVLLLAFSLTTCEEKTFNELTGDGTLLKEIIADGEINYKYTYNDANFVKEEKSKYHYTEHFYNSKNRLTQTDYYFDISLSSSNSSVSQEALNRTEWVTPENTERSSYVTFEYNSNGKLTASTIRRANNVNDRSTYEYHNDLIKKRILHNEGQISAMEVYFYDENDNVIKLEKYSYLLGSEPVLTSTNEYFFDDNNNPYLSFKALMIPGKHTNKNNITKEILTIYSLDDGSVTDVQTNEYVYSYNAKKFPVKRNDGIEYTYY
ncbi:MAG: hypothetical protein JXR61_12605 [Prolixibacteraceae bacterium]|nr:hypothetical protein [Prolixibacteraceae bacterium]